MESARLGHETLHPPAASRPSYGTPNRGVMTKFLALLIGLILWAQPSAAVLRVTDPPFNADPTGIVDSTSAFQAAQAACAGQDLVIPSAPGAQGQYRTQSVTWNAPCHVICEGGEYGGAIIRSLNPTGDVWTVNAYGWTMSGCGFDVLPGYAARQAGAYIYFAGLSQRNVVSHSLMQNWAQGIRFAPNGGNSTFDLDHIQLYNGAPSIGIGILVQNGAAMHFDSLQIAGATHFLAGLQVQQTADLSISNAQILGAHHGMDVNPGAWQSVTSLKVSHTYLDNNDGAALYMQPSDPNGSILRVTFDDVEFTSTHTGFGIFLDTTQFGGGINDVVFLAPRVHLNTSTGVQLGGSGVQNITFITPEVGGNSGNGIYAGSGLNGLKILGGIIGASPPIGGNGGLGLYIDASVPGFYVGSGATINGNGGGNASIGGPIGGWRVFQTYP